MGSAFAIGVVTAALGALMPACYRLPEPDCGFVCGSNGSCPDEYTCGADNVCRRHGATTDAVCPKHDAAPDATIDAPEDAL